MRTPFNKILAIAASLLLIANVVLVLFLLKGKDHHKGGRFQGKGEPAEFMAKELGMSKEQKSAFKKMREAHFSDCRPLFDSMSSIRKTFFTLVQSSAPADSLIQDYSSRIASVQAEIDRNTLKHFREVRNLFQGDQLKKYDEFVQNMMQRSSGSMRSGKGRKDSAGH